ncbi:MAG: M28 family metallopeptidase [Gemmatimonadales bacterium]
MKPTPRLLVASLALLVTSGAPLVTKLHAQSGIADRYRKTANEIIEAALGDSAAYERLSVMVDRFGNRLSGSENLERAIDWMLDEMRKDGLANVHGEEVMVPRWVRGRESAILIEPRYRRLPMLGLGGSIATPPQGITAEVLVVRSFEELEQRADEAAGKIVLFNAPFVGYGRTVRYRVGGASAAAKVGAVASLIRSVTPYSIQTPHTGVMRYDENTRKIPHAAITPEDAAMLQRMQDRGERVIVRLQMEAQTLPDVPSRNAIGEITGSQNPEEIVVLGGHIDSWDVGQGAMDDGGGVVAAWEAVRLIKRLGLRPRRTVRVVAWTNEENGSRGAEGYRDAHSDELDRHVFAMESDGGVFKPSGIGFSGTDEAFAMARDIGALLAPIDASVTRGGGGADVGPLQRAGVPVGGLRVDGSRYFWFHHTDADTIDKLDPHEMALSVAVMAVMAYVVADMPERFPPGPGR